MDRSGLPVNLEAEPTFLDVYGEGAALLRRYAELLARYGEQLGLLGPQEYGRLWTRHIINSVLPAELLQGSVADVGSGAGLPGIPLAIVRPDLPFTLVEPMERRAEWLLRVRDDLGLGNVEVVRARAEELHGTFHVERVTARAVAALTKLIPWTVPLLRPGGELVLMKGQTVEKEITAAAKAISKYKLEGVQVELLGSDLPTEPTRVLRARLRG